MKLSDHKMTVNIPREIHAEIKALSARRYLTMTQWLMKAIALMIKEERKHD